MRELNLNECEMAAGGGITVGRDGSVTSSRGVMTDGADGSFSIRTDDGWSYYRNSDSSWSVFNPEGNLVNSGIYVLNPP